MSKGAAKRAKGQKRSNSLEIPLSELKDILGRVKAGQGVSEEEISKLDAAIDTLAVLTQEIEMKGASIARLRRLIFGRSTEKTRHVVGRGSGGSGEKESDEAGNASASEALQGSEEAKADSEDSNVSPSCEEMETEKKSKGHGRNGAASYTGATRRTVALDGLKSGDPCRLCPRGKVYPMEPSRLVRVMGMAPIQATVLELERLRCNACGKVFTALAPEGVGDEKYDASAAGMIAMLKYGCGMPFHRLERLEESLGIPLPASTQWEVVEPAAEVVAPVFGELIREAAQGDILHNDDTSVEILELRGLMNDTTLIDDEGDPHGKERTGKFTSGIVSVKEDRKIALFFSGQKHAGENLASVLAKRAAELPPPIQMSDALSSNTAKGSATIRGSCNSHARRKFVDLAESFPAEVRYVLDELKLVYAADHVARAEKLSDDARLIYHQEHSGPVMERLKRWLTEQIDGHHVEPNSSLGKAICYMSKHWDKLTLFLRQKGAPLDNNICERILKKAIQHRKNSLFFKTINGARVGDVFMSLIHTAELCKANPYHYIVSMLRHPADVEESPEDWMPWNYQSALAELENITNPS